MDTCFIFFVRPWNCEVVKPSQIHALLGGIIMSITIDQLIKLPELKDLKLVSGSKGISKTVKWVHFIETPEDVGYIQNDELILFTGIGILDNKEHFIELIKGAIEKKAAGLIVNIGKYIQEIPDYIKKISDENNFPVFELSWEVNLSQLTKSICNYILKNCPQKLPYQDLLSNIISFNSITYEDFMESIALFGYASLNSFRIIIGTVVSFEQYLSSKNIRDEQKILDIKNSLLCSINSLIWDAKCLPISFLKNGSVVFLMINEKDTSIDLEIFSETIKKTVKNQFPDIDVNIGIGNSYTKYSYIKRSYLEAEKALKFLKAQDKKDGTVFYSEIGAYKLVTAIEDIGLLKEYYDDTVGKLDKYDAQNNTDFSKIFYVFLQEDGNCIKASQKLYLHRNTLMYKINKIQEIIERDVTDTDARFEFYLGYIIKRMNNF
jgi:sugar diacid utilization regulator